MAKPKALAVKKYSCPFIEVKQGDMSFMLTRVPAWVLVDATYVSIRGVHEEEGAVQRFLSQQRISSIRDFTIEVGIYPASIILNWTNKKHKISRFENTLEIPVIERGAQIIDGQHRKAGIAAAIRQKPALRDFLVPVAIFEGLDTSRCADIFISINTQQKPVPKSLVYDLFSEASDHIANRGVQRATDIARFLNEDDDSPYNGLVKFPGARYQRGGIALSTVVTAVRPLVEEKGEFDQIKLSNFEEQTQIILNYLSCFADVYGDGWAKTNNAFVYAAGFTGATEFFRKRVIPYCIKKRSFKRATMKECIGITKDSLIHQEEVRGKSGKAAVDHIFERLDSAFDIGDDGGHGFEI